MTDARFELLQDLLNWSAFFFDPVKDSMFAPHVRGLACLWDLRDQQTGGQEKAALCLRDWLLAVEFDVLTFLGILLLLYIAWTFRRVHGGLSLLITGAGFLVGAAILVALSGSLLPGGALWANRPDIDRVALTAAVIFLFFYLPRLGMGLRALLSSPRVDPRAQDEHRILPSQWATIRRLVENCGGGSRGTSRQLQRTPQEGKIISLNAGWGTGKTFILRYFQLLSVLPRVKMAREAEDLPVNLVVSYYNAWSNQMEADPEFAIVRHLVSDRHVMWPCGWITVPAWRILWRELLSALGGLGKMSFKLSEVSVEGGGGQSRRA
ncbi:P-loop NTPase fold protein [Stagnihabitans tardus]|uniref:KAP NTPase domain-containing protein n=1 Tax=Stagnihabitans tardus TaxID=2699202 RepID=A0AAE4YHK4_9RHOB|nr:P-loop NTPase fold protein [Stagnihabitans tardus]NBZ89940.1 hypothetical protein [Stagnihabitans tardus]